MAAPRRSSAPIALAAALALMAGRAAAAETVGGETPARDASAEAVEPDTRDERWRALRRSKRARLAPRRPGRIERTLLTIEKAERPSLLDLNLAGVYPRVQNIARGSQPAAGLRLWRPEIGGTPLDVEASAFYSLRKYEFYDFQLGRLPHRGRGFPPRSTRGDDVYELGDVRATGPRVTAYASLRYLHEPRTAFYGLGDSLASARTTFLYQHATYEGVAGYQPRPRLGFRVRAGIKQVFIGPGSEKTSLATQAVFDDTTAPGLTRQPDFVHWGASVLLDGRDEPGAPHRGAMLAAGWEAFDDLDSSSYRFDRFSADARAFLPVGSHQRVLALRARVSSDHAAAGSVVPFYFQETLGGGHNLRGFHTYRFRGTKVVLGQAEYRWEAWPALQLALFADAGRVFTTDEGLSLRDLEHDWGFGFRLKTSDATVLHFDTAFSREGTRAVVRLGSSF
jgi:surface antigen Omp85-like protein